MRSALADALRAPLGWEPWLRKAAGVWGLRPGACGAPSHLHTRCAAPQTTTSSREQLPAALSTDGSKDSVAKVWSFEERPPVLRLCGAAAESSARKKKSTAPNVIRLLLIHVDICFLLVHVELGQYHVQGRYSG